MISWSGRLPAWPVWRVPSLAVLTMIVLTVLTLPARASTPVTLLDTSFDHSITQYVSLLEDPDGSLLPEQVASRDYQLRFSPSHANAIRLGVTHSVYWFRISITNPIAEHRHSMLVLSNSHLGATALYQIADPQHPVIISDSHKGDAPQGSYLQAKSWLLELDNRETRTYLLRVEGNGLFNADIRLMTLDRYIMKEQCDVLVLGLVCGWLLATAAWFLYTGMTRPSRMAGWSAAFCAGSAVFVLAWVGMFELLLNIDSATSEILFELSGGIALMAQIMAVREIGWRGAATQTLRHVLLIAAAVGLLFGVVLSVIAGSFSELIGLLVLIVAQLVLSLVLGLFDSQYPPVQRWLLSGSLGAIATIMVVVLSSFNLLSLDIMTLWTVLLLPSALALSLVLASFQQNRQDTRYPEKRSRGMMVAPEMLSQISHDLRSPISGVLGMTELLADTPLSNNQREFTDSISLAGREILHIANEISDLARIQDDHLELEARSLDMMHLVNSTLAHFQPEANRKQVELVVDQSDDLPSRQLGDRNRLQTLLHGLFSNLTAYTEMGEIKVHLSQHHSSGERDHGICMQVQLQGNITNRDDLRALLEHMGGIHNQSPKSSWTQLVMHQLMRFMDASLQLESLTPQGGSLTLYLPQQKAAADSSIAPVADDSLIGMHILVVDDNASMRNVIEKQIRRWGVRVDSTHSGKEALAMMRNQCALGQPYDGAIVDLDMPVMDGLELARRMRDDDQIPAKPNVLILTGLSISNIRDRAREAGIHHLLAKPASGERLKRALQELRYRPERPSSFS